VHPGWVQTEMENWTAERSRAVRDEAPMTVEEEVMGFVKVLDEVTREGTFGGFCEYDGTVIP
jgi:hypothetical protein